MQPRNERVKTSMVRRRATALTHREPRRGPLARPRLARRVADGDERELHARVADAHRIPGADAGTLGDALAVDEGAEAAVIEQQQLAALAQEGAVAARHAGEALAEGNGV